MTDSPPPALLPKRPTMADVAASAGVSRSLVSTVFRGVPGASAETLQRVFTSAEDLGYRMDNRARLLRRSRTKTLGVLFRLPDAFQADLVACRRLSAWLLRCDAAWRVLPLSARRE